MPVKRWLVRLAWVLVGAAAVHVGAIAALPRVVVAVVIHRLASVVGMNQIHHAKLPDATWRTVVMPSPDQLYSACAFDVGDHPLLVTAEVPDGYWSLSLFANDTTNFYVLDDRQVRGHRARVVVTNGQEVRDASAVVVRSPSARGVALFRLLVLDRKDLAAMERIQHAARCGPWTGG